MRTIRMPASSRARSSTVLLLPVGLIALAAGIGLGPRHYAEEGLTATAATGVVLLAAGVALVILYVVREAAIRLLWRRMCERLNATAAERERVLRFAL